MPVKFKGNNHDYERLDRLKKRRNWLWNRVYQADKKGKNLDYDKAEASALDWAIAIIEGLNEDNLSM